MTPAPITPTPEQIEAPQRDIASIVAEARAMAFEEAAQYHDAKARKWRKEAKKHVRPGGYSSDHERHDIERAERHEKDAAAIRARARAAAERDPGGTVPAGGGEGPERGVPAPATSGPSSDAGDKCAACGWPCKEHSHSGACYGLCGEFQPGSSPEVSGYVETATDAYGFWRCPECRCNSYARVNEQKPDGKFGPGPLVRCVHCKRVYLMSEVADPDPDTLIDRHPLLGQTCGNYRGPIDEETLRLVEQMKKELGANTSTEMFRKALVLAKRVRDEVFAAADPGQGVDAREVLREVEWGDKCIGFNRCPSCGKADLFGHDINCRIAAAIAQPDQVAGLRADIEAERNLRHFWEAQYMSVEGKLHDVTVQNTATEAARAKAEAERDELSAALYPFVRYAAAVLVDGMEGEHGEVYKGGFRVSICNRDLRRARDVYARTAPGGEVGR